MEKQRDQNLDMVTDAGDASIWCKDEANLIMDHITAIRALIAERDAAIAQLSEANRALGEAEAKLAASEMAGIVEGWKSRAEAAEAKLERAREALEPFAKVSPRGLHGGPMVQAVITYEDGTDEVSARFKSVIPPNAFTRARAALDEMGDG
jgi:multidrug resistance efflux pump